MNYRIIIKALGHLLLIEAVLLGICLVVALTEGESRLTTWIVPAALTTAIGIGCIAWGRHAQNRMSRRDGYLIVSLTWAVFALFGTLPFLIDGSTTRLAAAYFEAMSGFSTTGATAIDHLDYLPASILLWRSLTHWIGGMGIVFFTIAVLPTMGVGEQKLFSAEATGLKIGKLHPRVSTTARWLWGLYVLLTVACAFSYYAVGMSPFDAINHAFSTIATGGFSTHDASMAYFRSPAVEYVAAGFMLLASVNFTLLYLGLVKGQVRRVFRDGELRVFLTLLLIEVTVVFVVLVLQDDRPVRESFRRALFDSVSLQSTTGFTVENFMAWHPLVWVVLTCLPVIGSCAGSTSGGIKCIRLYSALKYTVSEFRHILHPHAVIPLRLGGQTIAPSVGRTIFAFFTVYALLAFLGQVAFLLMGLPWMDAVGLSLSSLSNIGPCVGHFIGPTTSWSQLPDAALWLSSFLMLAGRLEIFSLILPFLPAFWKEH